MLGRLTRTEDFERLRKEGARWRGQYCVLNAARASLQDPSNEAITRVGYITSKSIGSAVRRNRARRLLREAARALDLDQFIPSGWDIVLIAQPAITKQDARFQQVRDDLQWLLNRANITNTARSTSTPSPNRCA